LLRECKQNKDDMQGKGQDLAGFGGVAGILFFQKKGGVKRGKDRYIHVKKVGSNIIGDGSDIYRR